MLQALVSAALGNALLESQKSSSSVGRSHSLRTSSSLKGTRKDISASRTRISDGLCWNTHMNIFLKIKLSSSKKKRNLVSLLEISARILQKNLQELQRHYLHSDICGIVVSFNQLVHAKNTESSKDKKCIFKKRVKLRVNIIVSSRLIIISLYNSAHREEEIPQR